MRLGKDENGKYAISFNFDDVPTVYVDNMNCPACGGRIIRTVNGYSCENRGKEEGGCYFYLGEVAGKKLTEEQVRTILSGEETEVIRGFKSKNNKPFNAKLVMKTSENGKKEITFDFEGVEPDYLADVVCPDCGGRIIKKTVGFGCENFKADDPQSCKFFIGKIAQKQISEANVIELLKEGRTGTIRGFKSKDKKPFDACLVMKKNENGVSEISFDFENVEAKTVKGVTCPLCGGDIVKTPFGYGCSNYKKDDPENSCKFNIGAIAGKNLKDAQIKELLLTGETTKISGFKSKSGKPFEAKLALDKGEDGKVKGIRFVFESEDEVMEDAKCPICGKQIIKGHLGYRCEDYKKGDEGCSFFIGKIAGVMIDKENFKKLVNEKITDKIAGFTSKKGTSFDAKLAFDEKFNVVFNFDN